jgi:hypothetical protein
MQLAMRSFAALRTFHSILMASGTDIVEFAEKESTMPWCKRSQETLVRLLSPQPQGYQNLASLLYTFDTCRRCHRVFGLVDLWDWEEIVEFVETGKSLAGVLEYLVSEKEGIFGSSVHYCKNCRVRVRSPTESDGSQDDQAENSDENTESDSEDDEDPLTGMRVSGMGYEQTEEGADASSSDESSSSRSSSHEDFGEDMDLSQL